MEPKENAVNSIKMEKNENTDAGPSKEPKSPETKPVEKIEP